MENEREPMSKLSRGRWMPEAHQSPCARNDTVMSERTVRPKVGERQPCGTSTECSSEHGAIASVNELMVRMSTLTDAFLSAER